jgi:hypothetical protein
MNEKDICEDKKKVLEEFNVSYGMVPKWIEDLWKD